MTNKVDDETIARITELRSQHMKRHEIAATLSITFFQLKRIIASSNIPPRATKQQERDAAILARKTPPSSVIPVDDGMSLMDKAKSILGARIGERKNMGYTLDGVLCNTDKILRAAGLSQKRS